MELNELIKIKRQELGLTLRDVAQKLGVAESTVLRSESKSIQNMGADKIVALADILQCSPAMLLNGGARPPQTADDANVIDTQPIPAAWLADGDQYIAFRVNDISMYPRYLEGDLVIVKATLACPDGQDALVAADQPEAILRRVEHAQDGALTFTAYNPEYPPKRCRPEEAGGAILGVVREMRRSFPVP